MKHTIATDKMNVEGEMIRNFKHRENVTKKDMNRERRRRS
jgi:hypothetical protein